ncbi:phosphoribosyl-AMP cyclohydrolase [Comamonas sp. BIGb0124]|nr:phosphoribosyl-AMP cyclohydrolase [Comamonas sp. BIGb0124]
MRDFPVRNCCAVPATFPGRGFRTLGVCHAGQMTDNGVMNWLDEVKWDEQGLVPVIAQEHGSKDVLMFAWMNREALARTAELRRAVYYSRSRGKLWFKGEESGHVQIVHDIRLDCDNDVVLLEVTQTGHEPGIACHTGRHSCFFKRHDNDTWLTVEPVLKDPASIYK